MYRGIGLSEVVDESLLVASELYEVTVDVSQRVGPLHEAIVKAGISVLECKLDTSLTVVVLDSLYTS